MTRCILCHTFIHDTLETSIREKFPSRFPRVKHLLGRMTDDFRIALHEYMRNTPMCTTMIQDIRNYMDFIGREKVLESFIESAKPIRQILAILEGELLDVGFEKLVKIQSWLRDISLDLFMLTIDIHLEHTKQKPIAIPKGQPTATLIPKEQVAVDDPLYF